MKLNLLFSVLMLSMQLSLHETKTVSYTFDVRYISSDIYDGVWKEKILTINGQFPGPEVRASVGDLLQIDVINSIQDGQNTTIHWHGINQKGTPDMDGPGMISQCPLKAGSRMRYTFKVEEPGTYWYHGHVRSQYTEGLWGILIVENEPEAYSYDGDLSIALSDWYYQTAEENEDWYLSSRSKGFPPHPDTIMINGRGTYPCGVARTLRRRCNPKLQVRPRFNLNFGRRYRIRVINTSSRAIFTFSIENHSLVPIEVDGVDIDRSQSSLAIADSAVIAPGQRYSFFIHRKSKSNSKRKYEIRADVHNFAVDNTSNINPRPDAMIKRVTALINYNGVAGQSEVGPDETLLRKNSLIEIVVGVNEIINVPMTVPETNQTFEAKRSDISVDYDSVSLLENTFNTLSRPAQDLEELLLTPYDKVEAPDHYDIEFVLNAEFRPTSDNTSRFMFNRRLFKLPQDKPILYKVRDGDKLEKHLNILTIPHYGSVVQIVINNERAEHPFHLHGHTFWIMGKGKGIYDEDESGDQLILNGPRRDTVLMGPDSWVVLRFIADNPGVWGFHCHIDWHNLAGMALNIVEAPMAFRNTVKLSPEGRRVCNLFNE